MYIIRRTPRKYADDGAVCGVNFSNLGKLITEY